MVEHRKLIEGFYQVTRNEVEISGLKREYVFAHISDNHVNAWDAHYDPEDAAQMKAGEKLWSGNRAWCANALGFDERWLPEYNISSAEMLSLLEDTSLPVTAVLCGHTHGEFLTETAPGRKIFCVSAGMMAYVHQLVLKPAGQIFGI